MALRHGGRFGCQRRVEREGHNSLNFIQYYRVWLGRDGWNGPEVGAKIVKPGSLEIL